MIISITLLLAIFAGNVCAQDWPQFLGPLRNGASPETGILRSWPETGPEILWTANIGKGFGGPVIGNGKVYLLDRDDEKGDIMRCFDFDNGKELWSFSYDAPGTVSYPGSRSVPAIDGNRVYSCGQNGDLYCIDVNTHKPLWNKNIMKDFGGVNLPIWAISQCPLIYGDLLVVSYSKDPYAGLVAFDKLTGDIKWKTEAIGNETYASPTVAKITGEDHIIMAFSSTNTFMHREVNRSPGKILGLKPQTGKILWEYNNWENMIQTAPAIDAGEGRIVVAGGYELGVVMIEVEKKPDGSFSVTELFKHNDFGEHTKPPLFHNGYFYGQYSTNNRRDGLCCMNMDGKVMWKTMRSPSFDKGSMILADGLILATDGSKKIYLIQPDPSGFKPLASAEILGMGQNWGPIALVDGKLLIRDQSRLLCIKVAQ
ncbi:MAG: outer membrane biogenesis protein BamB [Bacteroidetes bacterium ADurb.Bin123]|nr:MAG: outer membrane biogenesis protein BamB [Bacteroidetes bacterium ADurb.Bin123]